MISLNFVLRLKFDGEDDENDEKPIGGDSDEELDKKLEKIFEENYNDFSKSSGLS